MRADTALLVGSAGVLGGLAVAAPVAVAAVATFGLVVARAASRKALALAVLAFVGNAVAARAEIDRFVAARSAAREAIGRPSICAGSATVASSPTKRDTIVSYDAVVEELDCEGRRVRGPLRIRVHGGSGDLARGDRISLIAKLAPVRSFRNAELPDPTPGAARRGAALTGSALFVAATERATGIRPLIDHARARARDRIERTFAPEAAPMARALVLGENDLGSVDDEAFKKSGLAHLLAVSGTHLVFAVVAVVRALSFVLVRIEPWAASVDVRRLSAAAGACLSIAYADFAGGSGSAWRAAWMLAAAFGAQALARRATPARMLGASLGIGALTDPLAGFDLSFGLSAAATTGLLLLGRPLAHRFGRARSWVARYVATSVIATVTSMIPCAPLLAVMAPELSAAGLLANVVAAPLGELVSLPLCLAHALLAPFPRIEQGAAIVASGALLSVRAVAHWSAAAEPLQFGVPPPSRWHFAIFAVGLLGALFARSRAVRAAWGAWGAIGLVILEMAAARAGRPVGSLRVTAVDVGQGDCTLVDLPDGSLMIVDGGGFVSSSVDPGRSVILPLLRARRRSKIDVAVLSHPHPDHFGGLATVLARLPPAELWDSGQGVREGAGPAYDAMITRARHHGVRVLGPEALCGPPRRFGRAAVTLLGPCPRFRPGVDPNDNSMVVSIRLGSRTALLVGDAEADQEALLLATARNRLRADFLKVGHHGSRTSTTPEFLAAVGPSFATISCGVRNRFGHPHDETLATLFDHGTATYRLDRHGSVAWQTDGRRDSLSVFGRDR